MMSLGVLLAFLLPTLAGYGALSWVLGRPRSVAAHGASLGAGFLFGAMALGTILSLFDGASVSAIARGGTTALLGLALLLAVVHWRSRTVLSDSPAPAEATPPPGLKRSVWPPVIALLLLAALAMLVLQALYLPTLGWDAWNAWLAKPKAWFHADALVDAVSFADWAGAPSGSVITATGWPYPEALPRYVFWLVAMTGQWNEAVVHLAWPLAWAALGGCVAGYLALEGVGRTQAMASAAFLLLLPMIMAHAALAGYADLWMAAMLLLASVHLHRWLRGGGWREFCAALAFTLLLPMIKAEGAVWMLFLFASAALARLPLRRAVAGIAIALLLWAAFLPWGGMQLPLPGLGWVRLGWGEIGIEKFGTMVLGWQSVGEQVFQTLFLLPNWLLLWYLAPIVLALGWRAIPRDPGLRGLAWFLGLGYVFLLVLFLFTDVSAWAENFTSVNRVLMHAVPTTVFWLSLLWARRAGHGRSQATPA